MFELTVKDHFSSAHFLQGYDGCCSKMHGHTWKVAVTIQGEALNNIGIMLDFVQMKKFLAQVIMPLDHSCLNDQEYFKTHNPTAENLARYIHQEFKPLVAPVKLLKVQVWESDRADAVYYE